MTDYEAIVADIKYWIRNDGKIGYTQLHLIFNKHREPGDSFDEIAKVLVDFGVLKKTRRLHTLNLTFDRCEINYDGLLLMEGIDSIKAKI